MVIIEDTRQKVEKHTIKHESFSSGGDVLIRSKLIFGDYALPPKIVVDTKENIQEIAYNMCGPMKEKKRFADECFNAQECGSKLVFLIEDARYQKPTDLIGERIWLHNKQIVNGEQLSKAMYVMESRYGVEFRFCDPKDSANIIKEILTNG